MSAQRKAFTLVELLVVIGIIALLISILLPALAKARESSMRTKCMNNHKQLVFAVHAYAHDNGGSVPFINSNRLESNGHYQGPGWLYWKQYGKTELDHLKKGVLWKYVKSTDIYRCPFDQLGQQDSGVRRLTSYLINSEVNNYDNRPGGFTIFKASAFRANDIMFWEVDDEQGGGYWNDGTNYPSEGLTNRHGAGKGDEGLGIISCFGGNAEWISLRQYDQLESVGGNVRNRLYCNPRRPF